MTENARQPGHQLNKKMIERLVIIHNAIKAGLYPDNRALRRIYCKQTGYGKVGEATINRDIDTLRTYFHAPLEFDRTKGGYYYTNPRWDFVLSNISAEDVFYLSAAKTLLSSFAGSPLFSAISSVIDFVTDTQGPGKSALLKRVAVPPKPKTSVDEGVWNAMLSAVQNNLIVEFDYSGRWNTQATRRRFAPYQFLFDDGMCFVFGRSLDRDAERVFSLGRIKNPVVTDEHFSLPADFDFTSRCGGGKFGVFMSDDSISFTIDFYGASREFVRERVWADDQVLTDSDDEGKTRLSFSSTQSPKVMEWILSQGADAVPVAPEWFVAEWKAEIARMQERVR